MCPYIITTLLTKVNTHRFMTHGLETTNNSVYFFLEFNLKIDYKIFYIYMPFLSTRSIQNNYKNFRVSGKYLLKYYERITSKCLKFYCML